MVIDYFYLAAAVGAYAVGLLCQSVGAKRSAPSDVRFGSLIRLIGDPVYVVGFCCQTAGFVLAFLARAQLPLYLVQGAVCASVALASFLGFVFLGRRTSVRELTVFAVMTVAVAILLAASQPSAGYELSRAVIAGLAVVTAVLFGATFVAVRFSGAVPLACLAGMSFAVLAVAGRPVAAALGPSLVIDPLAWIVLATAVIGQIQMALALARGSTTAVGSVMDATTMVVASGAGFALLGDRISEGRTVWVAAGLVLSVVGVGAMARIETGRHPGPAVREPNLTDAVDTTAVRGVK